MFGATCLTQDLNQKNQQQFWQQFQKASLKTQKSPAARRWWLEISGHSSQPSETASRSSKAGSPENFGSPQQVLFYRLVTQFGPPKRPAEADSVSSQSASLATEAVQTNFQMYMRDLEETKAPRSDRKCLIF